MPTKTKTYIPKRTRSPKDLRIQAILNNPLLAIRELNNRSFYRFLQYFWDEVSQDELILNWHMEYLCNELQIISERVARNEDKLYDLIINIPPGSTKTIIVNIMWPAWCWTRWFYMNFISAGYSGALSLESAEYSRDLIRSDKFKAVYPELTIKQDKDTKSNFRVVKEIYRYKGQVPRRSVGGKRLSTSIGGSMTGYHGHILIVDDPINPHKALSEVELANTNRWMDNTLPTRKTNKKVTPLVLVMQRLHEDDPSGHLLKKKKEKIKHISIPGEIVNYKDQLSPKELEKYYVNGLFDKNRMDWGVLQELEADLGQYGFSGQIGQKPTPAGGGMFKIDHFQKIESLNMVNIIDIVRYWDKAGTGKNELKKGRKAAYTAGVKIAKRKDGKFIILDVKRGQWSTDERERIIRETAEADGTNTAIYIEQEPGSGGKESAQATIKNLAGFRIDKDHPTGDKVYRADPYSVQVNNGNVLLLNANWNQPFINEHEHFPNSTYKDQVDAAAGAFNKLNHKKIARRIT